MTVVTLGAERKEKIERDVMQLKVTWKITSFPLFSR